MRTILIFNGVCYITKYMHSWVIGLRLEGSLVLHRLYRNMDSSCSTEVIVCVT